MELKLEVRHFDKVDNIKAELQPVLDPLRRRTCTESLKTWISRDCLKAMHPKIKLFFLTKVRLYID